jgi:hypothetical protein
VRFGYACHIKTCHSGREIGLELRGYDICQHKKILVRIQKRKLDIEQLRGELEIVKQRMPCATSKLASLYAAIQNRISTPKYI